MKRWNVMLLLVMAAAVGLFGCYLLWIHNNLDTTGPVITVEEGLLEISVKDPAEALMQGVRAVDDRDGDVTASVLIESIYGINENKESTVTYAAFDAAGNVTKTQRVIRYRDYHAPRFTLSRSLTYAYGRKIDLLQDVGAEDVLEGSIGRRIHAALISETASIETEGVHQVKLQVANSLGDTVQLVVPVEVYDPEWYNAEVTLSAYLVYLKAGTQFNPRSYLKSFVVRGEAQNLNGITPEGIAVEIDSKVRMDVPGLYEVRYVLSQTEGMTTHTGIAKLLVIVE